MRRMQGSYALIQFSPVPERMEFLNIGVLLIVPEMQFVSVRFAKAHPRIDRYFMHPQPAYLDGLKASLAARVRSDFSRSVSIEALQHFADRRANEIQFSPFMPVAVIEPEATLNQLFEDLVGEKEVVHRRPRMARRLKDAFVKAKIYGFLDERPEPVQIPEAGISVKAPFGYQNGAYNLIDGLQFGSDRNEAMKEAGKRALEGELLWKHSNQTGEQKRLVVVADFGELPDRFYDAVGEQLEESHVRLYRWDEMGPLLEDIEQNARLHPESGRSKQ